MPLTLNVLSVNRPNGDQLITRISTAANGEQANKGSYNAQVSADGHYVVFRSYAANLAAGAVNGNGDIFRKNLLTGAIELISVGLGGAAANDYSSEAAISADGRYVAFTSRASNLVTGDSQNGYRDIFVKDLGAPDGALMCISTGLNGVAGNGASSNAHLGVNAQGRRFVVFESTAPNLAVGNGAYSDIFMKYLDAPNDAPILLTTGLLGLGADRGSYNPQISADGQYVVFESLASNLVGDDGNGITDIFRRNLETGAIQRVSTSSTGAGADQDCYNAQVSANGRYVVFESAATNLIGDDTQNSTDVFYKDMDTGAIVRVATGGSGGYVQSARISADGRYVTFQSDADDLVAGDHNNSYDIFRKDMLTGAIERLSTTTVAAQGKVQANGSSIKPQVSADGRYVTFASDADNLVAGDGNHSRDIFRHDLATGETIRVSLGINGEAESGSSNAQVSADGRFVTFESSATNLLGDDTNPNHRDVFLRDLQLNTLVRVSATPTGTIANADSQNSRMTEDGKGVLFDTAASNLVTNDVTGYIKFSIGISRLTASRACRPTPGNGRQRS